MTFYFRVIDTKIYIYIYTTYNISKCMLVHRLKANLTRIINSKKCNYLIDSNHY